MAKLELLWQMKRIFPQDLQTSVALAINSGKRAKGIKMSNG